MKGGAAPSNKIESIYNSCFYYARIDGAVHCMTRKDSEKDAERPHYYSQFWLDVAAGRKIIGAPKGEDGDIMDPDINESSAPVRMSTSARTAHDDFDDTDQDNEYAEEAIAHPVVTPDEVSEPLDVEMEPNDLGDPDIQNDEVEDANIPDMDLGTIDEDEGEQDEDLFDEEDEDEDEDDGWSARGRKKPSPKRPTKQPPAKKPKRETRRGF